MGWDEDGDCLTITVKGKTVLTWFDSHSRLLYPPLWVVQGGTWWASSAELLSALSSLSLFYHPAPAWILLKGQHFFLKKKYLLQHGFSTGCSRYLFLQLEHLFLLFLWPWCSHCCFSLFLVYIFLPFLCLSGIPCPFIEMPSTCVMGLAVSCGGSIAEQAGAGSVWHRGNPWPLLTEVPPAAPPLPTPFHGHPIEQETIFWVCIYRGS